MILTVLIPIPSWSQELELNQLKSEYRKGNYNFVETRTKLEIEKKRFIQLDDNLVFLYISSASNLKDMDTVLDRVYISKKDHSSLFYNSVFLILERGLVVGDFKLVEKWGFRFRQKGHQSPRYAEGLYVYASMFYETKRFQDANYILTLAMLENPSKELEAKILRLRNYTRLEQSG